MKSILCWITALCCAGLLGARLLAAPAPTVKNRQITQQKRIKQGVQSGELTRREARKLERNAARIYRSTRKDRVDGGVFTARERAKAQRKLNRQSRKIYREKSDNQSR